MPRTLLSARLVGGTSVPIPLGAFHAAEPDPLREQVPAATRHLEESHGAELLACVRANGHDAQAVVPRALDRAGGEPLEDYTRIKHVMANIA